MTQNEPWQRAPDLGQRETGTGRLDEAVAAYRDALKERTRDRVPLDWAMTQMNLGNALRTLGERETGTAHLDEAVAAYRDALKERTRDRVPLDWAMTQAILRSPWPRSIAGPMAIFRRRLPRSMALWRFSASSGATAYIEKGEAIRRSITGENPA